MYHSMQAYLKTKLSEISLLFCFIFLFGFGAILQGQDLNWDLLQYHFYNGYAFIHHRFTLDIAPAMVQTYYNPLLDVVNYLFISLQKPKLTEFLLGSFTGLSCFFLYKITRLFFNTAYVDPISKNQKNFAILSALLIGMTGSLSLSLLNTTTNDNKMSLFVIMAVYCLLKVSLSGPYARRYVSAGGVLIGLATGFKLPAFCYFLGLLFALLFTTQPNRRIRYTLLFIGSSALGFLLANGYWMFTLYNQFQNPLFPLYNNVFHSPYAPYLSFNNPINTQPLQVMEYIFLPFLLTVKNTLTTDTMCRDMRLATVFILSILLGVKFLFGKEASHNSNLTARFIFSFFFVSYTVWLGIFAIYRYILPLEWLSGILIVYGIFLLIKRPLLQYVILIFLIAFSISWTVLPSWSKQQPYLPEYFSMQTPNLPKQSTILLMTVPLSYVIPFFPNSVQFIGIPFLTIRVDPNNEATMHPRYLVEVMKKVIQQTSVYTLSFTESDYFEQKSRRILHHFGVIVQENQCQTFKTNIGQHLKLCSTLSP